jgi:hypothetical protein
MSTATGITTDFSARETVLRRIRRLSILLDSSITIPGTKFKIGLDPLIGLLPGAGDLVTTGLACYIVIEAHRLGAPASILLRMIGNVAIDALVGAIPVLGDIFDFAWKCNVRNMRLLEKFLDR